MEPRTLVRTRMGIISYHKQDFIESLSKHFFCFEQIPPHWQATNVLFPPLQDPLRKARLPTTSPKMVGVRTKEKCSPHLWPYLRRHLTRLAKIWPLHNYGNKRTTGSRVKFILRMLVIREEFSIRWSTVAQNSIISVRHLISITHFSARHHSITWGVAR